MDTSYIESDIESQINKEALKKNNEELDRICKKCCLTVGWILVLVLFIYFITIVIKNKLN